ncbi:Ribonuclease P protein component [Nostocoides japonicum T1-X7]|uniref:Ribonuclease P protein component n=1 Tax=Nostocoides japonicum T1-X7 TaxID=1194083 RepID=A0A077M349_9MICO|nr:ribonuclease P protein component [Tetrasphaera japonica]CCH80161.1 Ribonuclease P protein component [Tetrasphaera japonica T1-X7]
MLPSRHRLRHRAEFAAVMRGTGGARAASRLVVVHAKRTDARTGEPPRVGFVVSKKVGTAVTRNRVKRRLRALVAARLSGIPAGHDLVVRANPACSTASSAALGADLDRVLPAALGRVRR